MWQLSIYCVKNCSEFFHFWLGLFKGRLDETDETRVPPLDPRR